MCNKSKQKKRTPRKLELGKDNLTLMVQINIFMHSFPVKMGHWGSGNWKK